MADKQNVQEVKTKPEVLEEHEVLEDKNAGSSAQKVRKKTVNSTARRIEAAFIDVMDSLYGDKYPQEIFDSFHAEFDTQFSRLKAAMSGKSWKAVEECFPGVSEHILKRTAQVIAGRYFPFIKFKAAEEFDTYDEFYADFLEGNFIVIGTVKGISSVIPETLRQYREQTNYTGTITLEQFITDIDPATGEPASSLYSQCAREIDPEALEAAINSCKEEPSVIIEDKKYWPMLHGEATDAMTAMLGQEFNINEFNNTGTLKKNNVTLELSGIGQKKFLSVSSQKLLSTAITEFTSKNHTDGKRRIDALRVSFPFSSYAIACGYDIEEHKTATPEEAAKEKKRAANTQKKVKSIIKKDIETLRDISLSVTDKRSGNFSITGIIGAGKIINDYIEIEFTLSFADYLIKRPITQYPKALLAVNSRNSNAYSLGLKFSEYFFMDSNQINGKANLLSIFSLLNVTNLPDIEKVRAARKSWEERIKEPFENALDELTRCGLLKDWTYSHAKSVLLSDAEAANITDFNIWKDLYIYFELKDASINFDRIERNKERKKESAQKQKKTK